MIGLRPNHFTKGIDLGQDFGLKKPKAVFRKCLANNTASSAMQSLVPKSEKICRLLGEDLIVLELDDLGRMAINV